MNFSLFCLIIIVIGIQRLSELFVSRRNEEKLRKKSAIEYGRKQYFWMKLLHFLWFPTLITEAHFIGSSYGEDLTLLLISLVLFCQVIRFWTMISLGENWVTKIMVVPHSKPIKKGPYRYLSHPNYLIVFLEFILIPLLYKCFVTLFVFSILNILLLRSRIKLENIALRSLA